MFRNVQEKEVSQTIQASKLLFLTQRSYSRYFPFFNADEIHASFCRFGNLTVDWPHKAESKSYFPPKGTTNNQNLKSIISIQIQRLNLATLIISSVNFRRFYLQGTRSCYLKRKFQSNALWNLALNKTKSSICVSPVRQSKTNQ